MILNWSGKRGSNSRPQPWQGCALPAELFPHHKWVVNITSSNLGFKSYFNRYYLILTLKQLHYYQYHLSGNWELQ